MPFSSFSLFNFLHSRNALEIICWPFIFLLQSQDYQYASYMPLLADAVGQSLSTRPDVTGTEISKVRWKKISTLLCISVSFVPKVYIKFQMVQYIHDARINFWQYK